MNAILRTISRNRNALPLPPRPRDPADRAAALDYLQRLGPKACLLAWLPIVGDPLCAVAGWLRMPFWPCTAYMLVGKFLRRGVPTGTPLHAYRSDPLVVGRVSSSPVVFQSE